MINTFVFLTKDGRFRAVNNAYEVGIALDDGWSQITEKEFMERAAAVKADRYAAPKQKKGKRATKKGE